MANEYARLDDYEARYGTLGDSASDRIEQLLDDAALYIDAAVAKYDIDKEAKSAALTMVCCARARYVEERGDGTSSRTQQAGPYSLTVNYSRPVVDFDTWFNEQFGSLFGIGGGGIACIALGLGGCNVD